MVDQLTKIAQNPVVVLFSRIIATLGLALATGAVFIFQDMRATQSAALRDISSDLKYINQNMANLKGDMMSGNQQLRDLRERIKSIEDRVYK